MYVNPAASSSILSTTAQPSALQIGSTDAAFAALLNDDADTPENILTQITKDGVTGMMKWQIDQMKKKITDQVMTSKNLTADKIAAMPAKQRVAVEQQIMDAVAQQLKLAMSQQMKKNNHNQLGFDMSDPSPATASADAVSVNMLA